MTVAEPEEDPQPDGGTPKRQRLLILGHKVLSLDVMQLIAFLVAASFAIGELMMTRHDRRIDASLAFAERFTEGEVGKQRRLLDRAWYARGNVLSTISVQPEMQMAAIHAFVRQYILEVDKTKPRSEREIDLRLAIAEIADTLDQLALCVKPPCSWGICTRMSRCDAPIAREYFCTYAQSFTAVYGQVLDGIESELDTPPLGEAARAFSAHPDCRKLTEMP